VVSIKNGASGALRDIRAALDWLEGFEEVVLCFDMDAPGRKAASECAALFTPGKARIASLPYKDANLCLTEGRIQELTSALWNAAPYRPDGIRNIHDLKEASRKAAPEGVPFRYPELSHMLRGIRGGERIQRRRELVIGTVRHQVQAVRLPVAVMTPVIS
jgi:twinkle protein